jgi:hypothetical protein
VIVGQCEQHGVPGSDVDAQTAEHVAGSFGREIDDDSLEATLLHAGKNVSDVDPFFRSDADGIEAAPEHERAEVISGGDESSDFHNPGIITLGEQLVEARKFISAN